MEKDLFVSILNLQCRYCDQGGMVRETPKNCAGRKDCALFF